MGNPESLFCQAKFTNFLISHSTIRNVVINPKHSQVLASGKIRSFLLGSTAILMEPGNS